ncbi:hypothetical protein GCM10010430_54530 [Kitasatospora cystarginea]|uniref:Uncharacterized protein n=1 Tax=Kitasatospora cystarginea TaxID=58350 RepID=A0ABP5RMQ0_9ACTN
MPHSRAGGQPFTGRVPVTAVTSPVAHAPSRLCTQSNVLGRYSATASPPPAAAALRPLRDPDAAGLGLDEDDQV